MGLITKTVKMKWNAKNKKHYESLGYVYTGMGSEFYVKIEDLPKRSGVKVRCKCDGCGKPLDWGYNSYNNYVKGNGNTYCQICGNNLAQRGEAFSKSFYDWCIENKRQDVLERWDYELNKCSPKDISYGTSKKYWFKCNKHKWHESELKIVGSFTQGREGSIACNQCNSIAQYIIDNFPDKSLYDVWDKDKNGELDPWQVARKSIKKIWVKCQEKDYHGSYETKCYIFSGGCKCPYCSNKNGRVHPRDSIGQYIIDNYGKGFLHKIWSDKNNISPFELSPNSAKKVWWRCIDGKHEDYLRACNNSFVYDFRCPKCVKDMKNSIIEEKAKIYLEKIGYNVLTEYNCTIRPINPKTGYCLPYDNEIVLSNGKHLIIEVHGGQHYNSHYYKTVNKCSDEEAEKMLKQRRLYDRYKKAYAEHWNYEYLELPYTVFNKKETYKQMIDDKIEEILHNEKAS